MEHVIMSFLIAAAVSGECGLLILYLRRRERGRDGRSESALVRHRLMRSGILAGIHSHPATETCVHCSTATPGLSPTPSASSTDQPTPAQPARVEGTPAPSARRGTTA